jgi:hypothetical protein
VCDHQLSPTKLPKIFGKEIAQEPHAHGEQEKKQKDGLKIQNAKLNGCIKHPSYGRNEKKGEQSAFRHQKYVGAKNTLFHFVNSPLVKVQGLYIRININVSAKICAAMAVSF